MLEQATLPYRHTRLLVTHGEQRQIRKREANSRNRREEKINSNQSPSTIIIYADFNADQPTDNLAQCSIFPLSCLIDKSNAIHYLLPIRFQLLSAVCFLSVFLSYLELWKLINNQSIVFHYYRFFVHLF